jgi:hypothetical protein
LSTKAFPAAAISCALCSLLADFILFCSISQPVVLVKNKAFNV